MSFIGHIPTNDDWVAQIFDARAARTGGLVRRSVADVERKIGLARLELEVRRRGFRLLAAGGQYVIVCTTPPIRVLV